MLLQNLNVGMRQLSLDLEEKGEHLFCLQILNFKLCKKGKPIRDGRLSFLEDYGANISDLKKGQKYTTVIE